MQSPYQLLVHAAQTWPEGIALVDEEGSLTYQALFEQTDALKSQLQAIGLSNQMGLAILGRNSRAFIAAMFAGMACDAVVLPLSHQLKSAEIAQILEDTGVHALLDDYSASSADLATSDSTQALAFGTQTLRFAWLTNAKPGPLTPLADAAFIRYTSGTTGASKGVVLSQGSIMARVVTASKALGLGPDDAVLWILPMAFHFLVSILVYIHVGAKIILCKDLLAASLIQAANQHQATLLYAAPMHFRLLAADPSGEAMPSLKYAISTSSAIPPAIATAFSDRFQIPVTQAYGIIEAGLPLIDQLGSDTNPHSVGFPAAGFEVALLDDKDSPVAPGSMGRLAIRGPGLFDAYLQPWQLAEELMPGGWFLTGDLAEQLSDGRFSIGGREKAMINVAGNKAFPEEIEAVLNSHPNISASRVFGQAHPLLGEVVYAEVVLKTQSDFDEEALLFYCRQRLSTYKVPYRLQAVAHIQHTLSGKIQRAKTTD